MKRIITTLTFVLLLSGCSEIKSNNIDNKKIKSLQTELDSLKKIIEKSANGTKGQIATFLTFQNNDAEEAMNFYVGLFDNSEILEVKRWGNEVAGKENTIKHATFLVNGKLFMCSDSPMKHQWNFTPGVSNFIECNSNDEIEILFGKLSENGNVLMPLDNYGWSSKFAFIEDRFGVSWQLNLM